MNLVHLYLRVILCQTCCLKIQAFFSNQLNKLKVCKNVLNLSQQYYDTRVKICSVNTALQKLRKLTTLTI